MSRTEDNTLVVLRLSTGDRVTVRTAARVVGPSHIGQTLAAARRGEQLLAARNGFAGYNPVVFAKRAVIAAELR